mgnify:FL=1
MKIAMPYQDGVLLEHFGRAKEFIIYNVSDLDPVTSEVIAPEDLSHAAVARVLKEHGVDVVLCGSIGEHARQAVEGEHMLVFSGITGAADDVLERFLQGNLEAVDGDFAAGGSCGGCSGGCASGGCAGCSGVWSFLGVSIIYAFLSGLSVSFHAGAIHTTYRSVIHTIPNGKWKNKFFVPFW